MERNPHSTEKNPSILVSGSSGVEGNMATGNHMAGVPEETIRHTGKTKAT